jgi:hypothetical protein
VPDLHRFPVFISFTQPLASFFGKNLERIVFKICWVSKPTSLAQLLNKWVLHGNGLFLFWFDFYWSQNVAKAVGSEPDLSKFQIKIWKSVKVLPWKYWCQIEEHILLYDWWTLYLSFQQLRSRYCRLMC